MKQLRAALSVSFVFWLLFGVCGGAYWLVGEWYARRQLPPEMRTPAVILQVYDDAVFYAVAKDTLAQCACAHQYRDITPPKEFDLADAVFVGEVVELKKTALDKKTGDYTEVVTFKVKKVWKGELESLVVITNRIDFCFNGFAEKEDWLLYAYKNKEGTLLTHLRSKAKSATDEPVGERFGRYSIAFD